MMAWLMNSSTIFGSNRMAHSSAVSAASVDVTAGNSVSVVRSLVIEESFTRAYTPALGVSVPTHHLPLWSSAPPHSISDRKVVVLPLAAAVISAMQWTL